MRADFKNTVLIGAVSGAAAGMMMGIFEMVIGLLQGMSFFAPLDAIGHIANQGVSLMHNSGTLIGEGLVIHMIISMMLGVAFAVIVTQLKALRSNASLAVLFTTAAALAVGVLNEFVIWPALDKSVTSMLHPATFLLGHIVFGAFVGIAIVKSSINKDQLVSA